MKFTLGFSHVLLVAMLALVGFAVGCGGNVAGNTYADNGGVVQIEFKSGGKAYMSMGPMTNTAVIRKAERKSRFRAKATRSNLPWMMTARSTALRAEWFRG